ncbi:MAG: hypothetical protein IJU81_04710 [Bacteroidales bacterium]|nr:hypothetical protein [Bacteroidales bacterium]
MKTNGTIALLILLALTCSSYAQADDTSAVRPAILHPTQFEWESPAKKITAGCNTELEKAKAIYHWICKSISYDMSYTIYDADQCWIEHKGVCQAYCELYHYLAKAVDLRTDIITGRAKIPDGDTSDHAWLLVYAEGKQMLVDPTWGAGSIVNDEFVFNPNDYWFDVDPYVMILSHYPFVPEYQRIDKPISLKEFLRLMPPPAPEIAAANIEAKQLYTMACKNKDSMFVQIFSPSKETFQLLDIPLIHPLHVGRYYNFRIVLPSPEWQIATWSANNKIARLFKISGDTAEAKIMPSMEGPFRIMISQPQDAKFTTLLEYTVAQPTKAEIEQQEKAEPLAAACLQAVANYNQQILRQYNVDGHSLLSAVKSGKCSGLPTFYNPTAFDMDLMEFPYTTTLAADKEYTITLRPHAEGEWAVICGATGYTEWQTNPDQSITITFKPVAGKTAQLAFKATGKTQYKVCLAYKCQ